MVEVGSVLGRGLWIVCWMGNRVNWIKMKPSLEMDNNNKKIAICYIGVFIFSALFYLFWYWSDGIILTPDADSYINMASDREPGYCFFLWILREIFGKDKYLHAAVILQCLIAAVAATAITYALWKWFKLHWTSAAIILMLQYGITFLNRFVAQRRYSYYNSIETEGLAYSFWIFFILSAAGLLYKRDKKNLLLCILWSVALISIRKQMLITLGILFLCLVYVWWKDKGRYIAVILALAIIAGCFAGVKLVDCTYNYMTRGVFASHTGDSSFILGTEIYLASEDMAEFINDEKRHDIFVEIMVRAKKQEYNIAYAGSGWQAKENHYSNSYDRIKFDIIMPVVREYQQEHKIFDISYEEFYNKITDSMMKELLLPVMPKLAELFGCNIIHGLITTVLKVHRILNWVALFLYGAYIAVFVILMRRHGKSVLFAALVMAAIVANVVLTSVTIYCQMRYMLYNTALFYQAGVIMCLEMRYMWCEKRNI